MADRNDLVFFGDDFDAILGILEEEEELDEQFRQAADQVSIGFFLSHPEFSEKRCALTFIFKSGNAERFYSCFYSTIALNAVKYFNYGKHRHPKLTTRLYII